MQPRADALGQTNSIGQNYGWRMCDTQGYGSWDGSETAMGGLHPKGEPDNFGFSHCCLLTRRLWLGARSVFQHWRVPLAMRSYIDHMLEAQQAQNYLI